MVLRFFTSRNSRFALDALDLALTVDHVLCAVGLGQADDLYARADDGLQILHAEAAGQVVDADDRFLGAEMQRFERVIDQKARRVLFRIGHGVLEVEHDAVRAVDMRVADHAGVIARNEHHASSEPVLAIHVHSTSH